MVSNRNGLCPCGSGLKYKKCCLKKDGQNSFASQQKAVSAFPSLKTGLKKKMEPGKPDVLFRSLAYIEGMIKAARLAKKTLDYLKPLVRIGTTTKELEILAHDFFLQHGAVSATLGYHGYPASICTSLNEVICHGIPNARPLQNGDIVNIDVSCVLDGYYGDTSAMVALGEISPTASDLIATTRQCLKLGIEAVQPWGRLGDIGAAIQPYAEKKGYSVVEMFVGHAIGKNFHESYLQVPHFGKKGTGPFLLPGMFFTIEPMINEGEKNAVLLEDGWTAITTDKKLSAQEEHTVFITKKGVRVITAEEDHLPILTEAELEICEEEHDFQNS